MIKNHFAGWVMLPILLLVQMVEPICYVVTLYTGLEFQEYYPEIFASVTAALMLIGKFRLEEKEIYSDKWRDQENLTVFWQDGDTLDINGEHHEID